MASFTDSLGSIGAGLGSYIGYQNTGDDRQKILDYLNQINANSDTLGASNFENLSTDPTTRASQMAALQRLSGLVSGGGNDATTMAELANANRSANSNEQAQRQALQQNLAARGLGGSGAEVSGLIAAQQGGANRGAQMSQQAASDAAQRYTAAINSQGQLAGSIRGQDYGQAADKARAMDAAALNKFNAKSQALKGLSDYYGNDMNAQIGAASGLGRAAGGTVGAAADAIAAYYTGGASLAAEGAIPSAGTSAPTQQTPAYNQQQAAQTGAPFVGSYAGLTKDKNYGYGSY